jgi:hypothetical protein
MKTLTWDSRPERKPWSEELLKSVALAKEELDRGNPEQFAQGYSGLSESLQIKLWAELFVAIARFESNWKPHEITSKLNSSRTANRPRRTTYLIDHRRSFS